MCSSMPQQSPAVRSLQHSQMSVVVGWSSPPILYRGSPVTPTAPWWSGCDSGRRGFSGGAHDTFYPRSRREMQGVPSSHPYIRQRQTPLTLHRANTCASRWKARRVHRNWWIPMVHWWLTQQGERVGLLLQQPSMYYIPSLPAARSISRKLRSTRNVIGWSYFFAAPESVKLWEAGAIAYNEYCEKNTIIDKSEGTRIAWLFNIVSCTWHEVFCKSIFFHNFTSDKNINSRMKCKTAELHFGQIVDNLRFYHN